MSDSAPTERTRLRLYHDLGFFDRDAINAVIDEAPVCQVSVVVDDAPYIQTTVHWRDSDRLYVHGAVKNKMVNALRQGAVACINVSHFDGYILPRSGFNHAVLYRSVIAFSKGRFLPSIFLVSVTLGFGVRWRRKSSCSFPGLSRGSKLSSRKRMEIKNALIRKRHFEIETKSIVANIRDEY